MRRRIGVYTQRSGPEEELLMSRTMLVSTVLLSTLTLSSSSLLRAQDGKDDKRPSILAGEKAPTGGGMPTFTGKGKVTEAINGDTGAVFDIGGGVTMTFPKGLPVGRSRLVTLQKAKGPLPGKLGNPKFQPIGPALDFTGAFNAGRAPIVLAYESKKDPVKRGMKLVVAMEVGTFCEGPNKAHKLKGGLCSGIEFQDAEYDSAGRRLFANLRSTGGLRMQFGLVPEAE
jgi:hypothetical protein